MSFLPTPQEITQRASPDEAQSQLLQTEQDLTLEKQDSKVCHTNVESADVDAGSHPSDTGPSVWQTGSSNVATSKENTAGCSGENAHRGLTEVPSSVKQADQTESSYKNVEHDLSVNFGGLHEDLACSQPLDTCCALLVNSNLHNSAEIAVSPTENGMGLKHNALDGESKFTEQHTSRGANESFNAFEENFDDCSKQQLLDQGSGAAVVVSMDLDGWQRFDSEGDEGHIVFGCDQAINRKVLKKGELWEQLLEEGLEDGETHLRSSVSQVEAETGIDSTFSGGNQFWLASPGNPFAEGLDRSSGFSQADLCTSNEFTAKSQLGESVEPNMVLPFKESPFHTTYTSKNCLRDMLVEEKGSQSNEPYNHGGNRPAKPRFPSFSDLRKPSSGSKNGPFASLFDQAPAFHADSHVHGIENGGEKWEANFDSMVPPAQGPRSFSMPREASSTQGQRQKKSFPFFASARSQSNPLGPASPKPSSVVKKVVSKVQTKPGENPNAAHNGKNSSTTDMEPKKRVWRCCICCTRGS